MDALRRQILDLSPQAHHSFGLIGPFTVIALSGVREVDLKVTAIPSRHISGVDDWVSPEIGHDL